MGAPAMRSPVKLPAARVASEVAPGESPSLVLDN